MGRVLVIEFDEQETPVFEEIMGAIKRHPTFERLKLNNDAVLELPGLKIYPDSRKIICGRKEVNLTTKEYKLLCLLAANKGIILTYGQIYQKIWDEEELGDESNTISCHIHNLRKKLEKVSPVLPFAIRCVRKIGYCLETDEAKQKSNAKNFIGI